MIYLVKLNASYYKNHIDVNSGSYEYKFIKQAIEAEKEYVCEMTQKSLLASDMIGFWDDKDILVILSGMITDEERSDLIDTLKFVTCKTVFVNTDLRVATKCRFYDEDFKKHFDKFLDQTSENYNFVPDCFVNNEERYGEMQFIERKQATVFGGNIDGRRMKYSIAADSFVKANLPVFPFVVSKQEGLDARLPYQVYKSVCKCYRYTFVISDASYESMHFITSRFHEALDSNMIPFVDADFDRDNVVVPDNYKLLYRSEEELVKKIKFMENDIVYRNAVFNQLNEIKEKALKRKYMLAATILR